MQLRSATSPSSHSNRYKRDLDHLVFLLIPTYLTDGSGLWLETVWRSSLSVSWNGADRIVQYQRNPPHSTSEAQNRAYYDKSLIIPTVGYHYLPYKDDTPNIVPPWQMTPTVIERLLSEQRITYDKDLHKVTWLHPPRQQDLFPRSHLQDRI